MAMQPVPALESHYPLHRAAVGRGVQTWREAGQGPTLVLLHGIGSGALGWAAQLQAFAGHCRVMAWDAPGYGESSALSNSAPRAGDYVQALIEWLEPLRTGPIVLVGHSLGAIVAAAAAVDDRLKLRGLLLASPAMGYGDSPVELREARQRERVELIGRLGPAGLADARSPGLCTPQVPQEALELVRWNMARVTAQGYTQAAHLLAHEVLRSHVQHVRVPMTVCCGELDRITPASVSERFALESAARFDLLPGAAHACYIEHAAVFNSVLADFLDSLLEVAHG